MGRFVGHTAHARISCPAAATVTPLVPPARQLPPETYVRSVLLYGPEGVGKTLLAESVARHTGALLLDISPKRLEGKYGVSGHASRRRCRPRAHEGA